MYHRKLIINHQIITYQYDALNHLTGSTKTVSGITQYTQSNTYDYRGKRISKTDDWFSEPTRDIKSCVAYIEDCVLKGEQELPDFKNAYYYYDSMHVGKEFMAIYDRDTGELYYYEGTS